MPVKSFSLSRRSPIATPQPSLSPRTLPWILRAGIPPPGVSAALWDAIAWLAGAVCLRLGVAHGLLRGSLETWWLGVLVLIAPALVLPYLAAIAPRFRLVLIYRALLLMTGLLLGGRL